MARKLKSFVVFVSFVIAGVVVSAQTKPTVVAEPEFKPPMDDAVKVEVEKTATKEAEPIAAKPIPDHLAEMKSREVARLEQIERRLNTLTELDEVLRQELLTTTEPKPSLFQARVEVATEVSRLKKEQNEILSVLYKGASREERKVRDKLEKQRKSEIRRSNREADAARTAHLRCPVEFDGKTVVNPEANSGMRNIDRTVYITINSPMDGEIFDVRTMNGKWIVTDFCPGGDMTASISRDWLYSGAKQVRLVARSRSGRVAYSPTYTIYPNFGYDYFTPRDTSIDWTPFPSRPSNGGRTVNSNSGNTGGGCGFAWFACGYVDR